MRCHGITSFLTPSFIHSRWLLARSSVEKEVPARHVLFASSPSSSANLSQLPNLPAPASHVTTITRLASPIPLHIGQTKIHVGDSTGLRSIPLLLPALATSAHVFTAGATLRSLAPNSRSASVTGYGCSVRPLMCGTVRAITPCGSSGPVGAVGAPSRSGGSRAVNPCTHAGYRSCIVDLLAFI